MNADNLFNIGNEYFGKQEFDKALEYYNQALKIRKESLPA
ncbi:MAG: tetratricopeptide repeat protein, partial [Burkholderiales bacterium]|nr:tetratricopeptide repeat protein [Burkholderiales bacterium]